jgi:hopanoid biosynthesis associated protein HpnK
MKRLIVSADDFGLTQLVSQGILDAHHYGIVTTTSLMATGGAFEEAIAMAARAPQLSVGVHLVLTQGIPVSRRHEIPTLVDGRGRLCLAANEFLRKVVTGCIDLREVETELRGQIVRVVRAGITPTHLDGHKHLHILPGISDIVIRLAQEFGIPSVRCPMEGLPLARLPHCLRDPQAGVFRQCFAGCAVSWFARRFRLKLTQAGLNYPTHFYGLSQTGFLNGESLEAILRYLPAGTSELMCHPGYADSLLAKTGTRLLAQREIESRALMSPRTRDLVISEGIQLVSYREFAHAIQESEVTAQDLEMKTTTGCEERV